MRLILFKNVPLYAWEVHRFCIIIFYRRRAGSCMHVDLEVKQLCHFAIMGPKVKLFVLAEAAALPLCSAVDSRWNRRVYHLQWPAGVILWWIMQVLNTTRLPFQQQWERNDGYPQGHHTWQSCCWLQILLLHPVWLVLMLCVTLTKCWQPKRMVYFAHVHGMRPVWPLAIDSK